MKKVLVTGVNSYVGNRFAAWVEQYPYEYEVDRISVREGKWRAIDLSIYDSILHVAGIAHRKETKESAEHYYRINSHLTKELALKAKKDGVSHFVFLSSMSVYGLDKGVIDEYSEPKPKTYYGKSKLEAEKHIEILADTSFKVAIVRPPMIYGKGCKGNYQRLRKLALKTPIFPDINNKRSMIHIDNLSEFLRLLINDTGYGTHCPQNKEYINTSKLVREICEYHESNIRLTKILNPVIRLLNLNILNKIFGSLVYKKNQNNKYCNNFISFERTVKLTEE